jgi:hypothetical protein
MTLRSSMTPSSAIVPGKFNDRAAAVAACPSCFSVSPGLNPMCSAALQCAARDRADSRSEARSISNDPLADAKDTTKREESSAHVESAFKQRIWYETGFCAIRRKTVRQQCRPDAFSVVLVNLVSSW